MKGEIVGSYHGHYIYIENGNIRVDGYDEYDFPTISEAYQFIEDQLN
jgi:hypothetical protein